MKIEVLSDIGIIHPDPEIRNGITVFIGNRAALQTLFDNCEGENRLHELMALPT